MKKKTLYIDMDNVLVDFPSGIEKITDEYKKEYDGRLDEVPGIFSLMEPIPGAIEAYKELSEIKKNVSLLKLKMLMYGIK